MKTCTIETTITELPDWATCAAQQWEWFDLSDAMFVIVQVFGDVTIVQ